jgi:D-alanyl-D-alanine carboxypeptidase/D-alanyl-D-alanine-endopeptidase (penicillin-binding protein 4)
MPGTSRALALCLLLVGAAGCAKPAAVTPPRLDPLQQLRLDIRAVTDEPGVGRAAWGIVVHSLDRDERLFELNPRTLLVPASVTKLISVASAADAVGWDFRYETTVEATAPIVDGTLTGDLIVVGSGDPSIGGRGGPSLDLFVEALRSAGLRRVEGRVIGDDDLIEEPRPQLAWAWDDLGYTTGALFGALNLGENRTVVTVGPGAAPGDAATLAPDPDSPVRALRSRVVTGEPGSPPLLWPEQRPGEPFLTIGGSLPAGGSPVPLPVAVGNPTAWFAASLREGLVRNGIEVGGDAVDMDDLETRPATEQRTRLFTHRSPTFAELAQPLLKESINLYGEAALRLNAAAAGPATNDDALDGLRVRLTTWGVAQDAWQIVDGSGLSRRNAVSPEALMAILERMYDSSGQSPWMTALPVAGRDGTLAGRMQDTPAADNVRAKTGTMSNVRTLAGYVRTRDGESLAFVVMANFFEGSGGQATDAIDHIAVRLAAFSRLAR